jgi:hypothetical protein
MRMTRVFAMLAAVAAVTLLRVNADGADQKVKMPKEGAVEYDFCFAGPGVIPVATKEFTGLTYTIAAEIRTTPPGGPFDQQSSRCWGVWKNVGGKVESTGFCEVVDQDGDKWYSDTHGNTEGTAGTFSVPYGTGKYAGMVMSGEWRELPYPMTADIIHGCPPAKATYKLAK